MRRGAELEGIDYEAELVLRILVRETEHLEHPLLHSSVMYPDGPAAELRAVEDEVVCVGADLFKVLLPVAVEQVQMLRLRCGERMVHGVEALCLVVPLEKREVHHPKRGECMRVAQPEPVPHLYAEHAEHGLRLPLRTAEHEDKVPPGCPHPVCYGLELLRSIELVYRRLDGTVLVHLYIYKTFRSDLRSLYPLCQLVQLLAGVARKARCADGTYILHRIEH